MNKDITTLQYYQVLQFLAADGKEYTADELGEIVGGQPGCALSVWSRTGFLDRSGCPSKYRINDRGRELLSLSPSEIFSVWRTALNQLKAASRSRPRRNPAAYLLDAAAIEIPVVSQAVEVPAPAPVLDPSIRAWVDAGYIVMLDGFTVAGRAT